MYHELLTGYVFVSFFVGSSLVVGHQALILTYLPNGQNIGDYLVLSFCSLGMSPGFV